MKLFRILLLCTFGLLTFQPAFAVGSAAIAPTAESAAVITPNLEGKSYKEMTRKERREFRKDMRKDLKTQLKALKKENASDNLILLVILAILLPPLAMGIYEGGLTSRFWISLLLTLLFYVPGLIYTLVIILGEN